MSFRLSATARVPLFRVRGRLGSLPAGDYRLLALATDGSRNRSRPAKAGFTAH